jgi:glutathione S-transferase
MLRAASALCHPFDALWSSTMLKIIGRGTSGNVMKVLWLADELRVPYEQEDLGGSFGGNDAPEFLARNPNGLVPVIEDDGVVLWESNAIVRYLAGKHGYGTLSPADPARRAVADQWMDWQQTVVAPTMSPIFWGLVRTPAAERDLPAIERAIQRAYPVWGILDAHLSRHLYVAGEFSMGDVPLGPHVHRWLRLVTNRPSMPHLEAWYQRLTQRPPYRKHCMGPLV